MAINGGLAAAVIEPIALVGLRGSGMKWPAGCAIG